MSILTLFFAYMGCQSQTPKEKPDYTNKQAIYQFKVKDINGKEFDFSTLKGKKVLIVNTASKCGFTPQYKELQELYLHYKDSGLMIVGFPANNFLHQEPGTDQEIESFCEKNYGVTFPMMSKISVKGEDQHPIYKYLTQRSENGYADTKVEWNFQKYLINESGFLEKVFYSKTKPMSDDIMNAIKKN